MGFLELDWVRKVLMIGLAVPLIFIGAYFRRNRVNDKSSEGRGKFLQILAVFNVLFLMVGDYLSVNLGPIVYNVCLLMCLVIDLFGAIIYTRKFHKS